MSTCVRVSRKKINRRAEVARFFHGGIDAERASERTIRVLHSQIERISLIEETRRRFAEMPLTPERVELLALARLGDAEQAADEAVRFRYEQMKRPV